MKLLPYLDVLNTCSDRLITSVYSVKIEIVLYHLHTRKALLKL